MQEYTGVDAGTRAQIEAVGTLEAVCREGARRMLMVTLEQEVAEYIDRHQDLRDEEGKRLVVRNGHHREREVATGIGKVPLRQPRVNDRREGEHFTSAILPRYLRRAPSIDALIPVLYLKGISSSSFPEALEAILGKGVSGLSPTNVVRLKEVWQQEFEVWAKRDLRGKRYVYLWADAVYFNVRLEKDRPCVLVVVAATKDGRKELLAIQDGERESHLSWKNLLLDLKARGLEDGPCLAIADRALGFWKALPEVFPETRAQQCWVHKTANVLDKLPKRLQADAKGLIHEMYLAPTREDAAEAYGRFLTLYEARYPKACECLKKDEDVLFTFYDFPAAHWVHLRTTNPIESTFGTVRHRTRQTKGCGSRTATLTMVFKLATQAEKHWRRLNGHNLIHLVMQGQEFVDGELKVAA
jgi:transposase-like protein